MTHDEVFLRDVLAHPDDDAPRLIYADWLDDHAEPARAELIRVQCEHASPAAGPARRAALWDRERELLREHELLWTAPLHGIVQRARFVRGFVEQVFVLVEDFLQHGEALFQLAPVRHVVFLEARAHWPQLMASPHLRHVSTFELRGGGMTADEASLLVGCPHLTQLRRLMLRYAADDEAVGVLARSKAVSRLTALDLYGAGLESEGAQALVRSPHLAGLSYLALGDFVAEGLDVAEALTDPGARLSGLTQLYLGWTQMGDEGARRLAASPKLARLQVLDLMGNQIGAAGGQALASSPHFQELQALHLQGNPLGRARRKLRERFVNRVWLDA